MPGKVHIQKALLWVTKLSLLTAGGKTPPAKSTLGLYAATLANDLPMSVFCEASCHEVAVGCEFFPAYSVLLTALQAWHETSERKRLASPVSVAFREHLDELQNNEAHKARLADRLAEARDDWSQPWKIRESLANIGEDHPHRLRLGRMLAALVRKHAPDNLGHIPPEFH